MVQSLRNSSGFCFPCAQITKKSTTHQNHTNGLDSALSINLVSISSLKMQAYVGANFVPMAVSNIFVVFNCNFCHFKKIVSEIIALLFL